MQRGRGTGGESSYGSGGNGGRRVGCDELLRGQLMRDSNTLSSCSLVPPPTIPRLLSCALGRGGDLWIGIFIGANAACINVITEWLSDFKLGFCSQGWYLNQQFCCWQEPQCQAFNPWSSLTLISYLFYILFAVRTRSIPPR
jgi:hypothetical protein